MYRKTVAIFVDAGFFTRYFTKIIDPNWEMPAEDLAHEMWAYWMKHVERKYDEEIYRIYFYDCPPLEDIHHHPLLNKQIDFSKGKTAIYKNALLNALRKKPYVACRMGELSATNRDWGFIREDSIHSFKNLITGKTDPSQIDPDNVSLRPRQKGVDMKIGVDITSVVLKKLANKIVLISGDSDFVPAAKLARTEGAHFILDAMGKKVNGKLAEHIDALKTYAHTVKPYQP